MPATATNTLQKTYVQTFQASFATETIPKITLRLNAFWDTVSKGHRVRSCFLAFEEKLDGFTLRLPVTADNSVFEVNNTPKTLSSMLYF